MKTAEKIFGIMAIVGIILSQAGIPGNSVLILVSFFALASLYFYLGFLFFNERTLKQFLKKEAFDEIKPMRIVGAALSGIALSMCVTGIMFQYMLWPGAYAMLEISLSLLLFISIVGIFRYAKNKSSYYITIFKRVSIYGSLTIILMLLPPYFFLELKYGNYPDYIEARKELDADPHNQELWDKVDEERKKMMENQ